MENEFWINVELLSYGGNIDLRVIPAKKYYEVLLDDMPLCTLQKDKELSWIDLDNRVDTYTAEVIGTAIDSYE